MHNSEQATDFQHVPGYGRQKGLWIPENILYCDGIGASEKMLLSLVYNLDRAGGCYASNTFIALALGWPIKSVERVLYALRNSGIVNIAHSQTGRRLFINTLENGGNPRKRGTLENEGKHPRKRGLKPSKTGENTLENEGHNINNINRIEREYKSSADFEKSATPAGAVVDLFGNPEQEQPEKKPKPAAKDWQDDTGFVKAWNAYRQLSSIRSVGAPAAAYNVWRKLRPADQKAVVERIPLFVQGHIETGAYPKDFKTFLNPQNRHWEAEPPSKAKPNGQQPGKKRMMAPGMGW